MVYARVGLKSSSEWSTACMHSNLKFELLLSAALVGTHLHHFRWAAQHISWNVPSTCLKLLTQRVWSDHKTTTHLRVTAMSMTTVLCTTVHGYSFNFAHNKINQRPQNAHIRYECNPQEPTLCCYELFRLLVPLRVEEEYSWASTCTYAVVQVQINYTQNTVNERASLHS